MSEPSDPVRVVLIAPALSVRLGLRALLSERLEIEIVGEAATPTQADWLLHRAQVVLVAVRSSASWRGFGETGPAVLLLFDEQPPRPLARIAAPAWGILPLDSSSHELAAAVLALSAGLCVADPAWMTGTVFLYSDMEPAHQQANNLTPRETEVLQQLSLGLANKQIAAVLGLSENTVKFHISSLYAKLGAGNRAEAVRLGARQGYITL